MDDYPDPAKAIEQLREAIAKLTRSPHVLVVDDDDGVCISLKAILKSFDCKVFCSPDGEQAIATLKESPFDLVLLDLKMPGMDGVEVYKHIRLNHPNLPVVIVTGFDTSPMVDAIRKMGAAIILPKPVELAVLKQIFSWVRI